MALENYQSQQPTLDEINRVLKKIENPNDPDKLHKFIDTAIYSSFKYHQRKLSCQTTKSLSSQNRQS